MRIPSVLLLFAAALSGCVLPPKEAAHPQPLTQDRVGLAGVAAEPVADGWWISFQDPQLDQLMREGLKDSPTLVQAQARLGEALAQTQSAQSKLLPSANLDASALYQRAPENYLIPPPLAGHSFWMSQAGASLGWDLDFWGHQADALHRAQALAQSAQYDVDNARLMLAGAIAQAYVELYREYALVDIAQRSWRRSGRTSSSSRATGSPPDSIRSSSCVKQKASCRRHAWRATRRRPPRILPFISLPP